MRVKEGGDVGLVAECCAACGDSVGAALFELRASVAADFAWTATASAWARCVEVARLAAAAAAVASASSLSTLFL